MYNDLTEGILALVDVTHGGYVNKNSSLYSNKALMNGAKTWIFPYPKPLILHHNWESDPLGRVAQISNAVKYVDLPKDYFYNSESGIEYDLNNLPTSKLQVVFYINDPKAVERIKDERYLTTSIGGTAKKVTCSICGQDIGEDGPCEHFKGERYDGELCYWTVDSLDYQENSIVVVPADQTDVHAARIVGWMPVDRYKAYIQEAKMKGISTEKIDIARIIEDKLSVEEFINEVTTNNDTKEVKDMSGVEKNNKTSPPVDDIENADATLTIEVVDSVKGDVNKTDEKIQNEDLSKQTTQKDAEEKEEPCPECGDPESDNENEVNDPNEEPSEEEYLEVDEEHYEAMWNYGYAEGVVDSEDAKLTPAQRKKMSKGTFCKPAERKYPVPDCSHAKVAMAYAKKNNESSSVISCIRRKAKALGCPFKNSADESLDSEVKQSKVYASMIKDLTDAYVDVIALLRFTLKKREFKESYENGVEWVKTKYVGRTTESLLDTIADLKEELSLDQGINIVSSSDLEDEEIIDKVEPEKEQVKDEKGKVVVTESQENVRKTIDKQATKGLALINNLIKDE